jgi:hypothetical protein
MFFILLERLRTQLFAHRHISYGEEKPTLMAPFSERVGIG